MARRLTVDEFLFDKWLPTIRTSIRKSTLISYESHVRNHVSPYLGSRRLDRIDPTVLNDLYVRLLESGRQNGTGLSPPSVRRVHATLHRALRDAVRWGLIERNPAASADPPKIGDRGEFSTWSADELRLFLKCVQDDSLYPLWVVLATTGMRRGEALGLRWCDVDLDRGELAVRQTVVSHSDAIAISEPKTAKGRRVIALDEHTVAVLRAYKARRPPTSEDSLLFCYRTGGPLNPSDISKRFNWLARDAGLRRIRLHDLRHTHATLALQAGVHPKIVSERLGHSTVSFTLDVYSHAVPHLQKEAAAQVAALVLGTGKRL